MSAQYDILVIGAGHAGAEAAHAAAKLGAKTALVTLDLNRIAQMSCNPAIGGLAKGQIVREIDALGGLMAIATDDTAIQFRMLNLSKGPAVWGPRAQADKYKYSQKVHALLEQTPNLTLLQKEATEILSHNGAVSGVRLADGTLLPCRAVIVTTGTFLRGLMHTGEKQTQGGRIGEPGANHLTASLEALGLEVGRLKTGTPPRLHRDSINYDKLEPQPGDETPLPFSYLNEYKGLWKPALPQVPCHLTSTHEQIHQIIRNNLHRAPMYSGQIKTTGPRYCPSIEDKVVRFADKTSHHIFLEPESLETPEVYVNGISTSLPSDVQDQIVHLIPGLEDAQILRFGYAIEYDMVWPTQIRSTMETKAVKGLFLAGQINGTSGYEEAAGQGLLAGINAFLYIKNGVADFTLRRDQAYIGVLADDLVTKPPTEPYRMFTSRAEHRLLLRNDNADERLTEIGRQIGLVDDGRWVRFAKMKETRETALALLAQTRIDGVSAAEWLKRSENTWQKLKTHPPFETFPDNILFRAEVAIKYEGYIARQTRQVHQLEKMECRKIPRDLDYTKVMGLRNEAKAKLIKFAPESLGQALRISGITPADVTLLSIHLNK